MKKHVKIIVWVLGGLAFIGGCIPDRFAAFSNDGKTGLVRKDKQIVLVNENLSEIRTVEKKAELTCNISADGKLIAYSTQKEFKTVAEFNEHLPEFQQKRLANDCQQLVNKYLRNDYSMRAFWRVIIEVLKADHRESEYKDILLKYLYEKADDKLKELAPELIVKKADKPLKANVLVVESLQNPQQEKRFIAGLNLFFQTKFSPDGRYLSFLIVNDENDKKSLPCPSGDLYICDMQDNFKLRLIARYISMGYSWTLDSQKVFYISFKSDSFNNNGLLLGEICWSKVIPTIADGKELIPENSSVALTGFYPFQNLQVDAAGRVFLSALHFDYPTAALDQEPRFVLYVLDPQAEKIDKLLGDLTDAKSGWFEISPDGTKMLVCLNGSRLGLYDIATGDLKTLDYTLKDDGNWSIFPQWKGNGQIALPIDNNDVKVPNATTMPMGKRATLLLIDIDGDVIEKP